MRGWTAGIGVCAALAAATAMAATKLMPAEIQSTFFTGEPFNATTPSGVKFKMTFTADGKAKRVPSGKGGQRSEGDWKLDENGYCTTWKGAPQNCFGVLNTADNKWSIMRGTLAIATWTK